MTDRFPLEPLATAAGITLGLTGGHQPGDPLSGLTALATRLDTSTSTLKRARAAGLTDTQADRWACALGKLPTEIWGNAWWTGIDGDDPLHGVAAVNDAKETCPKGHAYDRINTRGARSCSTCTNWNARWSRGIKGWRTAA